MREDFDGYSILWGDETTSTGNFPSPVVKDFRLETDKNSPVAENGLFVFYQGAYDDDNQLFALEMVYHRVNHKFVGKNKVQIRFRFLEARISSETTAKLLDAAEKRKTDNGS